MTVRVDGVDAVLAFGAALVALRLAGELARRRRLAWAGGLFAYAAAAAALAWGTAHGWDARSFRVYYLAGGLLTAPLLGAGSLLLTGRRWAAPVALVYTGLAVGVALAMPVHGSFAAEGVPTAGDHLGWLPKAIAIGGNSLGTVAVVGGRPAHDPAAAARQRPPPRGHRRRRPGSGLAGHERRDARRRAAVAVGLLYVGVSVSTREAATKSAARSLLTASSAATLYASASVG